MEQDDIIKYFEQGKAFLDSIPIRAHLKEKTGYVERVLEQVAVNELVYEIKKSGQGSNSKFFIWVISFEVLVVIFLLMRNCTSEPTRTQP